MSALLVFIFRKSAEDVNLDENDYENKKNYKINEVN
jgi:hypothetical protein